LFQRKIGTGNNDGRYADTGFADKPCKVYGTIVWLRWLQSDKSKQEYFIGGNGTTEDHPDPIPAAVVPEQIFSGHSFCYANSKHTTIMAMHTPHTPYVVCLTSGTFGPIRGFPQYHDDISDQRYSGRLHWIDKASLLMTDHVHLAR
jgi:hypothetical protein